LRFEVIATRAAFDALAKPWNGLAARAQLSRQGFQSFGWLSSWAEHYAGDGHELRVVLGWSGEALQLAWPLGARRRFGVTTLGFLGEPLSQYHDVLVEPGGLGEARLAAALDFVRGLPHDILWLRRVREDSQLAGALRAAGARALRTEQAPFIDFGEAKSFEAFERSLSAKERANRRRRLRHIHELGEISFASATAPEERAALIAVALGFKREWALKGGHYAPAMFDPRFERCLRDAAHAENPDAALRVFAIRLGGRPIGVEISFGYRDRLFGHVLAPDPALTKFGLGAALADAAIADAFAQGYKVYDLLAPANAYKFAWTSQAVEVTDYALTATRRGALAEAVFTRAAQTGRRWLRRAPPPLIRALLARGRAPNR